MQLEGRHRTGENALRASILGANKGLVSNLSLVMCMAGATLAGKGVMIAGLAGLLAGFNKLHTAMYITKRFNTILGYALFQPLDQIDRFGL